MFYITIEHKSCCGTKIFYIIHVLFYYIYFVLLQSCYFEYFSNNDSITMYETLIPKMLKSTCWKLWCLSACKNSTSSSASFLRYFKNIANLLLCELWECSTILIKNPSRNLSCLSKCKNRLSPTFFLRYCK